MGTTNKFMRRRRYASFLIEFTELENIVKSPYQLHMIISEAIESILRTCRCPLKISVDTSRYAQVSSEIERLNNTSSIVSNYRKNYSVKIYAINN